jgi:hypothetical protein
MQCNIDAKGKAVRLVIGSVVEMVGWTLGILWFVGAVPGWAGAIGLGAILGGSFAIFEGIAGWCAIRALGFRTPI